MYVHLEGTKFKCIRGLRILSRQRKLLLFGAYITVTMAPNHSSN